MRLSALLETGLSRRQFLKLGGQATVAAAMPNAVIDLLKSLPGTKIGITVWGDMNSHNVGDIFKRVTALHKVAKNIGNGIVFGGDISGDGYSYATHGPVDTITNLIKTGVLKPKKTKHDNLTFFTDNNGLSYAIEKPKNNNFPFTDEIANDEFEIHDPITNWWSAKHDNLDDKSFSQEAMQIIKQKGLYRSVENPLELRNLVDQFQKYKIQLPSDISQVISNIYDIHHRAGSIGPKWHELEYGDNWEIYDKRMRYREQQRKQQEKKEFDEAPPTQYEPGWETKTTEFEQKLNTTLTTKGN